MQLVICILWSVTSKIGFVKYHLNDINAKVNGLLIVTLKRSLIISPTIKYILWCCEYEVLLLLLLLIPWICFG